MKKVALVIALIGLVAGFFFFDLDRFLTLEAIKRSQNQFDAWRTAAPLLVGGLFFLAYVGVTALSLPGAAIMTLVAGALFGLWWGTLIVSFASSIGATLAFLAARYVFKDAVWQRFGDSLKPIDDGMRRDGAFYLFTLRLVPLFPFFLINLLMGLTSIKTLTFYWVSQVGMLAGTLVYVNAGTQLARIDRLGDIVSPPLLLSFALLGVFPLLARKVLAVVRKNRIYRQFPKPLRFDRNLVVIGAGAAGLVSAYIAAAVKARVTLVEAGKMGGDCLNYGCVPSKSLIRSAKLVQQIRDSERYGLDPMVPAVNFRKIMERVLGVIKKVEPHDSVERYTGLGVEVIKGYARITNPWTVEIAGSDGSNRRLTTRSIVVATGARPFVPPLPGLTEAGYLTSDTLWEELAKREHVPERLVVLGGGPIGVEMAQSFARLGSAVTQVEMSERILAREDEDVSRFVMQRLEQEGVRILTGHKAVRIDSADGRKRLILNHRGKEKEVEFDDIICAVGRVARLEGFGLEELGIPTSRTVETNEYLETVYPNIYAAGDVAGPYQFTHIASHQAWYAVVNALFGTFKRFKVDYSVVPWTTFADPEVARVGLNEQEARQRGIAHEVTRYDLDDLDRAIADSADHGFIKVLTVPGKDRILGVTIVGEHGGELLAEFVLAMKHGLGLNKILGTIHTYPTFAEANKYTAGVWKRAHAPEKLLALVERYHAWRRA